MASGRRIVDEEEESVRCGVIVEVYEERNEGHVGKELVIMGVWAGDEGG